MSAITQAWRQFICRACGLIYDEETGDPDSGLAPGTRFEDIPDDWECPLCGVTKLDFEPYVMREAPVAVAMPVGPRETGMVVVGGGLAGWSVIEAIRAIDQSTPITLVSGCKGDLYHKPGRPEREPAGCSSGCRVWCAVDGAAGKGLRRRFPAAGARQAEQRPRRRAHVPACRLTDRG